MRRKFTKTGGYSSTILIPKIWLDSQGNPEEVELHLGGSRIVAIPVTKAGRKVELINAEREKTEIK